MNTKTALVVLAVMLFAAIAGINRVAAVGGVDPPPLPPTAPVAAAATNPAAGDAGTDLVSTFYAALIQEQPPTMAQEIALFGADSVWAGRLVALGRGNQGEPVILQHLRQHKEWFFPKNLSVPIGHEDSLGSVQLTTTFKFVRSLRRIKEGRRTGYVLAMFLDDVRPPAGQTKRIRTMVFPIDKGKINASGIRLDGFQGKMLGELLEEVKQP